jgi:hypothetical protein
MIDYATYYEKRCEEASQDQGIDSLVKELKALGIDAEIAQTGGFTMCATSRSIRIDTFTRTLTVPESTMKRVS